MTQNQDNSFVYSKFGKVFLTIVSVALIFAGPTYVVYALVELLNVNLVASFVTGLVLLIVGLVLMRFLVQKKIIT
jgi:divalent metal cation (Fe/Co/Zn/Cd) transporter